MFTFWGQQHIVQGVSGPASKHLCLSLQSNFASGQYTRVQIGQLGSDSGPAPARERDVTFISPALDPLMGSVPDSLYAASKKSSLKEVQAFPGVAKAFASGKSSSRDSSVLTLEPVSTETDEWAGGAFDMYNLIKPNVMVQPTVPTESGQLLECHFKTDSRGSSA